MGKKAVALFSSFGCLSIWSGSDPDPCDMGAAVEMESVLKKTLKDLCCNIGWSYGVFWRFDQRNSM